MFGLRTLRRLKRRLFPKKTAPSPPSSPPTPVDPHTPTAAEDETVPQEVVALGEGCTPMSLPSLKVLLGASGEPRVINHWATWCAPCVEELPLLVELSARVPVVGVSWDLFEGGGVEVVAARVERFSGAHGLGYPSALVVAEPSAFFAAFGMTFEQIPQTWVLDRKGQIVHRVNGILSARDVEEIGAAVEAARKSEV